MLSYQVSLATLENNANGYGFGYDFLTAEVRDTVGNVLAVVDNRNDAWKSGVWQRQFEVDLTPLERNHRTDRLPRRQYRHPSDHLLGRQPEGRDLHPLKFRAPRGVTQCGSANDRREEAMPQNPKAAKPQSSPKRRIFPSAEAAFVTGCLMPTVAARLDRLLSQGTGDLWLFLFMVGGMMLPFIVSVVDLEAMRRRGAFSFLGIYRFPPWEKMLEELVPAWGRMAALLLGAFLSALVQHGGLHLRP